MENVEFATIPLRLLRELEDTCGRRRPYETCGVLFGHSTGTEMHVDGYALVRNAASDPEGAFAFDPKDWVRTASEAQKNQRSIVGFFHSHPAGSALPSRRDVQGRPPAGTYWIVGWIEETCEVRAYRMTGESGWKPLPLLIGTEASPSS
ncbi:hypothetical protein GE107_03320 [Cohnella sp. CFH 77786]|uniref:Mov34/MPN/PAD-1 family protein n=1 Tax=Cohnella sp. CFH 77786 TaxID=2662265 RepID=UPI001C60CA15|nr:M67 family metallopeptidase [Cohnella sp. CFH 77786]MBW5445094.1 hypothetical protein [Cohnella sp. CFH 77786]